MKFLKYFAVLATVAVLSGCFFFSKDKSSSPDEIDFSKLAWDYGCENIDTSNDCPTRDFKNIKSGYNDCKKDTVVTAIEYTFVIVIAILAT